MLPPSTPTHSLTPSSPLRAPCGLQGKRKGSAKGGKGGKGGNAAYESPVSPLVFASTVLALISFAFLSYAQHCM